MIEEQSSTEDRNAEKKSQRKAAKEERHKVADRIAEALGETSPHPKMMIRQIVKALGIKQSQDLLQETQQIEAGGGMILPDGSRRRTVGGVWFYLAYSKGKPEEGHIMPYRGYKSKKTKGDGQPEQPDTPAQSDATAQPAKSKPSEPQQPSQPKPQPTPAQPAFVLEDLLSIIDELQKEKGLLSTVKITLVGRPRQVMDKGNCFILSMKDSKVPALPKGVPAPAEAGSTLYVVFVAAKQWRKVAQVMDDPEDTLILEGYPQIDEKTKSIAVYVSNATTKKIQQGKRAPQPQPEG